MLLNKKQTQIKKDKINQFFDNDNSIYMVEYIESDSKFNYYHRKSQVNSKILYDMFNDYMYITIINATKIK